MNSLALRLGGRRRLVCDTRFSKSSVYREYVECVRHVIANGHRYDHPSARMVFGVRTYVMLELPDPQRFSAQIKFASPKEAA